MAPSGSICSQLCNRWKRNKGGGGGLPKVGSEVAWLPRATSHPDRGPEGQDIKQRLGKEGEKGLEVGGGGREIENWG